MSHTTYLTPSAPTFTTEDCGDEVTFENIESCEEISGPTPDISIFDGTFFFDGTIFAGFSP